MIVGLSDDAWLRVDPPHPGGLFKRGCLDGDDEYPGMTIGEAAAKLGVSRITVSRVVNEHNPVTLNLALRMEAAGWSTADQWLKHQMAYDLAQARKRLNQPPASAPAGLRKKQLLTESAAEAA